MFTDALMVLLSFAAGLLFLAYGFWRDVKELKRRFPELDCRVDYLENRRKLDAALKAGKYDAE